MPVTKTAADVVGSSASKTTITAGSISTSASIDASDFLGLTIGCSVDYGVSPDDDVLVELISSPDNTLFDDEAFASFLVPRSTSVTIQDTVRVGIEGVKYFKVRITNQDSADSVDVWGFIVDMTT